MTAAPRYFLLGIAGVAFSLAACAGRATDLNCSEVASMRTEQETAPSHMDPEQAAAEAITAADYVADASDEKSMRNVYAYDANDDLLAIVIVESVPGNDGWVAIGVDRCAT